MRIRSNWCTTSLLLVAILHVLVCVDATKKSAAKTLKRTEKCKHKPSDLEGSETSNFASFFSYNSLGSTYKPFIYTFGPQQSYAPTGHTAYAQAFAGSSNPFSAGKNATNILHQEIRCGDAFPRRCPNSRYRTYDGSCNNPYKPTWGMANTRYGRLVPANYGDGISSPTNSVTGGELPLSRLVSFSLFPSIDINDPIWTLAAMQWGQIIVHDMAMTDGSTQSKPHETMCCTDDGQLVESDLLHSTCYPIIIPYNDPVYSKSNIRCQNFVRTTTDLDRGCSPPNKPAEQLTVVTSYMDLSIVYGSSDEVARSLRAGFGGRLRVDVRNNHEWPPQAQNKSAVCENVHASEVCYLTGDLRVNQNTQLTVLHIILLREHNRIADILKHINPHWTDETIFQETRRILIAEHQHISYYEYLPIFLGMQNTYGSKILYNTDSYVNDYDPHVDPSVLNEHSTAAFRYFHSLIAGFLNLVNEFRYGTSFNSLRLSDYFNRPSVIEENNNMDDLTRGLSYQPEKASDRYFDKEITQFLFRNGQPLGQDLRAIDIQRNRDHGLASYNDLREYCGLPRAKDWTGFMDYISASNVQKLADLYASPDDVDLTVGGSLERHVEGALAGPTFLCILTKQFYKTRVADRYWFERGDHEAAFTIEQLQEIRKTSISRLFCDNGNHIVTMQPRGFQQVSPDNPIMNCNDLPAMDLSLWKDYGPELELHTQSAFHFKK